jgi:hypothetical protein
MRITKLLFLLICCFWLSAQYRGQGYQQASGGCQNTAGNFKLGKGSGSNADAVELSQKAQQLDSGVTKFIAVKSFPNASAQSIKIAETCTACRRLYRPL